jgi:uncharacterized protein
VTESGHRVWVAGASPAERSAFAEAAVPFLARDEARNNLQLSILDAVLTGRYHEAVLVAAVDADGEVAAVLLRTPPWPLLLASGCAPAALEAALAWMFEHDPDAPGITGPLPESADAAARWAARRGLAVRRQMHQGVYALRAVLPRVRAGGSARLVTEDDRARVVPWLQAFQLEALGRIETEADVAFTSYVGHPLRRLLVWQTESGELVSLAGRGGRTPHGVRIGPVYTPPEHRGRGYGEALVAAMSQRELDEGAQACYLYTDLDYGASNRLYLRVGYAKIGESAEMRFEARGG